MEEVRSIIATYDKNSLIKSGHDPSKKPKKLEASYSDIPDVFFDEVLVQNKLKRSEVLLLMYLYRITWCRSNIHQKHGISPLVDYEEVSAKLAMSIPEFHQVIHSLSAYGFIEVIRAGQYFVRRYFLKELDLRYGQTYDDFF